jgi:hypothetical protein
LIFVSFAMVMQSPQEEPKTVMNVFRSKAMPPHALTAL